MTVMDRYLTVEEVAQELKVSKDTIWRMLNRKELVGFKVAGVWRVTRQDLEIYVEAQKKKQAE
jgi:putative molybdopterin biosynthesis protein